MQGFGGASFRQVFPVLRVFYTEVGRSRHYRNKSGNDVLGNVTQKPRKPLGFRGFGLQTRGS